MPNAQHPFGIERVLHFRTDWTFVECYPFCDIQHQQEQMFHRRDTVLFQALKNTSPLKHNSLIELQSTGNN